MFEEMNYNRLINKSDEMDDDQSGLLDNNNSAEYIGDGPLKPVPSLDEQNVHKFDIEWQREHNQFHFKDIKPLLMLMRIFFMSTPETNSIVVKILIPCIQLVMVAFALLANCLSLWQFDLLPFQKLAESLYIARMLMAYVFLIIHLKKRTLPQLVKTVLQISPSSVHTLAKRYAIAWIVIALIGAAGVISTYLEYASHLFGGAYKVRMALLLIGSSLMYQFLWAGSLIIFWFNLHLLAIQWRQYVNKLKKGYFHKIHGALVEHASLTESISENNANWEVYLFCSLSFLIPSIMSSLYISLLPKYTSISIWTVGLLIDCGYLLSMFIPGAVITTRIRRVLKITNKLRAVTDPEDRKSIRQLESFLLYLYTNNASFKVAGVSVDLGFVTKLCLSIFSFCAFMVQRELASQ